MTRATAPFLAVLIAFAIGVTPALAAPPVISNTSVSTITPTSARLRGEVNPGGKATRYHFEYGTKACSEVPDPCTSTEEVKLPVPAGSTPEAVSADLSGLTPGTAYRFRLIAKGEGEVKGPEVSFTTFTLPVVFDKPCPNAQLRTGPSVRLPDCRAYEQATPVEKDGHDVGMNGGLNSTQASPSGDAVTYTNYSGMPGGDSFQNFPAYVARREGGAWETEGLLPPLSYGNDGRVIAWTPDLSYFLSYAYFTGEMGAGSTLLGHSADGAFASLVPYTLGIESVTFAGASADSSKIFFEAKVALTPGAAVGKRNLYLYDRGTGALSLVGALPGGSAPAGGAFAGTYEWFNGTNATTLQQAAADSSYYLQDEHAVSAAGDKAYFTAAGSGQLYLREGIGSASPQTLHVSASRKGNGGGDEGHDAAGESPAVFQQASADGSVAFFTSSEKLTNDAFTGPEPTGSPAIARAPIGGGAPELSFLPAHANGIAVAGGWIYWADPVDDTIGRAKLNGTGAPSEEDAEFVTGADNPLGVAAGPCFGGGECLYWINAAGEEEGEGTIGRAKLNGLGPVGEVNQSFIETSFNGTYNPRGIAVNNTHIFWGNNGRRNDNNTEALMRANLDGSGMGEYGGNSENPFHSGAEGVALDGNYVYYTEYQEQIPIPGFGCIRRFALAEEQSFKTLYCNVEAVEEEPGVVEIRNKGRVDGLAVDGSHLYWADYERDEIGRSDLEGNGADDEFITHAGIKRVLKENEEARVHRGLAVDSEHLYWATNQEVQANPGNDLYRFDAATNTLIDVTADSNPADVCPETDTPCGAQVQGVLGASEDGSYLYFVANGVLDPSSSATLGDCHGARPNAVNGECNLYLYHAGDTHPTFIARLRDSRGDWTPTSDRALGSAGEGRTARVSPDGTLLFMSQQPLTPGAGQEAFYLYRPGESTPICIACTPTGGTGAFTLTQGDLYHANASHVVFGGTSGFLTRNLSADGRRVFFQTDQKLVAADLNGDQSCPFGESSIGIGRICTDVYEWEEAGEGSCSTESTAFVAESGGCLFLLSTGTSSYPSYLSDVSAEGEVAFIFTREGLVPQDKDSLEDLYAVAVDGGLASQHPVAPPPCEAEACRGAGSSGPQGQGAGSASFAGPGNVAQPHLRDCAGPAARAQHLARLSKRLRRQASHASDAAAAAKLRHRALDLSKQAHELSKGARRCRQANRKASR
jgi:hypothetical protein